MKENEQVLAFPARLLAELGGGTAFQGILTGEDARRILAVVLSDEHLRFIPRAVAENDPTWKQVIPYISVISDGMYLRYQRTKAGKESRLHAKWSVGVGGHINPVDGQCDGKLTYTRGFFRELAEETGLLFKSASMCDATIRAVINDDSNPVGQVHFGVFHVVPLFDGQEIISPDPALRYTLFTNTARLMADIDQFENWSQLVIRHVLARE